MGKKKRPDKPLAQPIPQPKFPDYPDEWAAMEPPPPQYPAFVPAPFPATYRSATSSVMVTGDAAVAQVSYQVPDPDGGWATTFTGSGTSKRERGDKHDPVTGETLAAARAFGELSARLFREARRRVRVQDSERRQAAHRRTREEWEQLQRNNQLARNLFGTRTQAVHTGKLATEYAIDTDMLDIETPAEYQPHPAFEWAKPPAAPSQESLDAETDNPGLRIELSEGRFLAFEAGWVIVYYPNGTRLQLTRA